MSTPKHLAALRGVVLHLGVRLHQSAEGMSGCGRDLTKHICIDYIIHMNAFGCIMMLCGGVQYSVYCFISLPLCSVLVVPLSPGVSWT